MKISDLLALRTQLQIVVAQWEDQLDRTPEGKRVVREIVVPDWAVVMRERQRRRAEAEGRTYMEAEPLVIENPNDWASVM